MLRKLLFSVLVLSLFVAFTGTAFSDIKKPQSADADQRSTSVLKSDRMMDVYNHRADNEGTPAKTFTYTPEGLDVPYPSPYAPDHECEVLDLIDYSSSAYYSFDLVGVDDAGVHVSNRFEVQDFHNAVVYGAAIRIYDASAAGLDLNLHVWDDAGGIPGALLYSETIPAATIVANGAGHWLFSFASGIAVPGGAYHISYSTNGASNLDYITFGIAQNGDGTDNGTSNFSGDDGVSWITLTTAFGGFPLNARLSSDVCYVYNDCYATAISDASWFGPIGLPMDNGDGTAWTGLSQRHEAINDTLVSLTFAHLDQGAAAPLYAGTGETNGVIVEVWGDAAGAADIGAGPLASVAIPGGIASLFPSGGGGLGTWATEYIDVDLSSFGLIFRGAFHVSWRMDGTDPAGGALVPLLEGSAGGGGYIDANDGVNTIAAWNGSAHAFTINVELCRDEYQECQNQVLYTGSDWGSGFSLALDGDADGDFEPGVAPDGNYFEVAQLVKGRDFNRVEGASFMVANNNWYSGDPIGDMGVQFHVYSKTVNSNAIHYSFGEIIPDVPVWSSAVIPVNDASPWNAWGELWVDVVIPDVLTNGDFWVGYDGINLGGERIRATNDADWGPANVNGGGWLKYWGWDPSDPEWIPVSLFGYSTSSNWWITVDFCSVPQPEYACDPSGLAQWATLSGNYQRTGHALVGIGNAQCDLTMEWNYVHPGGKFGQFTGPIIVDNTIVATFRANSGTEYMTFDLTTKAPGYTLLMDGNVTGMPTVDGGVMYVSGGTSDQIVQAVDFATGVPIYTIGTTNALGIALGMGAGETNPYANFMVWNDGVDDVLYFSVDIGKVYAVYAATGAPYWAGPFVPTGFGSVSNRTGTLDAANGVLFYGYAAVVGGDVVALDATDGTQLWSLAGGNGLEGNNAWGGGVTIEQFQAGIAFDAVDDMLYTVSTCAGDFPIAGTLYQINAGTGLIVNAAQPVNGVSNAITPVLDVQNVLVPTRSVWVNGINTPFSLQAYAKSSLTLNFGTGWGTSSSDEYMVAEMLMTCETEADDYLFFFGRRGALHCINGNTGEELYSRRIVDQTFGGAGIAIANDGAGVAHLVAQDASSGLYSFTADVSRARLELLRGNDAESAARGEVPFGVDPAYVVTFTEMFKNTGCEDLNVEMTIALTSNGGPSTPYKTVSTQFGDNALDIALDLGYHHPFKVNNGSSVVETPLYDETVSYEKPLSMNPAALALGFINNEVLLATVAPDGEAVDVDVVVDQAAVGRGVFPRFLSFTSYNDADFWLDTYNTPADPEIMITFLGGCVMEFTPLAFGLDQTNEQVVFNSGRLVENGVGDFTIDGVAGVNFQAYYLYGVSDTALAFTIVSWLEGSGETSTWNGWLPELIDGQCVPVLTEAVALGNYSQDGLDYSSVILGNTVAYNSIDSVQDFTDPGEPDGWNHANFIAPFSNTLTMGLTVNHLTIGAYDFGFDVGNPGAGILDDIGNATIEIFDFTERNGNPVDDWKLMAYLDWDCRLSGAGVDTTRNDRSSSMSWTYDATESGNRVVGGQIKIPFNFCSNAADPNYLAPLKTSISMDQAQGMWGSLGSGGNDVYFLDSAYSTYGTLPWDSAEYHQGTLPADEDQAGAYILAEHSFTGNSSYRVAVGNFQFQNYATPTVAAGRMANLAHTLNKWMGFGRGDVNNDNVIDMMDIIYTSNYVGGGPGPIPFQYLGDVNVSGATDAADVTAIADYYFGSGGCFGGEWTL